MLPLSLTLSKHQRLKKPAQYQQVYKSKQWGHSRLYSFNVLAHESSGADVILGVTVSKKVSKRAVDRNNIKRQIKEFFRHHQSQLSDASLVITAKPACLKANKIERAESLVELWSKILGWQKWHKRQEAKKESK
jgi:ribonuclease P protein component